MPGCRLSERFDRPHLDPRLVWMNEPPRWQVLPAEGLLRVEPAAQTDFWCKTHYGFEVNNGHLLAMDVVGDFVLATQVRFQPRHQYDQAGLMLFLSASCWVKTSVEYEPDSPARLGAVVTNAGYSDWSTQDYPPGRNELALRIRREGHDVIVEHAATDSGAWSQLRVARLHESADGRPLRAGLYACSPKAAGFVAEFLHLSIDSAS